MWNRALLTTVFSNLKNATPIFVFGNVESRLMSVPWVSHFVSQRWGSRISIRSNFIKNSYLRVNGIWPVFPSLWICIFILDMSLPITLTWLRKVCMYDDKWLGMGLTNILANLKIKISRFPMLGMQFPEAGLI